MYVVSASRTVVSPRESVPPRRSDSAATRSTTTVRALESMVKKLKKFSSSEPVSRRPSRPAKASVLRSWARIAASTSSATTGRRTRKARRTTSVQHAGSPAGPDQ